MEPERVDRFKELFYEGLDSYSLTDAIKQAPRPFPPRIPFSLARRPHRVASSLPPAPLPRRPRLAPRPHPTRVPAASSLSLHGRTASPPPRRPPRLPAARATDASPC
ncbi:hypothetical protein PVAP13_4KG232415 [Panicum virgatum]|uniref:Uncharacterized protein n=1 Tax=Panicum virgatum TaxID=38727 RepID=A0A8T0TSC8_PANVG|nr:hypothetical protein PVAP13_4KG232415 [Panicum virgatum]